MKDKKFIILAFLFLLFLGYAQSVLYSPLTPKTAAIAHFKINPKIIPKPKTESTFILTETDIKNKHGRLELVKLLDNTIIRGVVIYQGDSFIRVETTVGVKQIQTDKIDTVEVIR